jgi:hypothetical protein
MVAAFGVVCEVTRRVRANARFKNCPVKIRFWFATISASVDSLWKAFTWLGFSEVLTMASLSDSLVRHLLESRYIASLATNNPDGSAHMVAVWYWFTGLMVRMFI